MRHVAQEEGISQRALLERAIALYLKQGVESAIATKGASTERLSRIERNLSVLGELLGLKAEDGELCSLRLMAIEQRLSELSSGKGKRKGKGFGG